MAVIGACSASKSEVSNTSTTTANAAATTSSSLVANGSRPGTTSDPAPTPSPTPTSLRGAAPSEFGVVSVVGNALPAEYSDSSDSSASSVNVAKGAQAPELYGHTFDGDQLNITNDDKPKVVMFFAHWCPHCQHEVPDLVKWLNTHQSSYGRVSFYAVATASDSAKPNFPPSEWLTNEGWPTPILADNKADDAATGFGLGAYPYFVVLDSHMKVVDRSSGELTDGQFTRLATEANGA